MAWSGCMLVWQALTWTISGWYIRPDVSAALARSMNKLMLSKGKVEWTAMLEMSPDTISRLIGNTKSPHGAMFRAVALPALSLICIGTAILSSTKGTSVLSTLEKVAVSVTTCLR